MSIASTIAGLIALTSYFPLWYAWRTNRDTSLWQAVLWAVVAWTAWVVAFFVEGFAGEASGRMAVYLALCLTGCAGVAVLGARQPGLNAWNFVVLGLLAVFCLPLFPPLIDGRPFELDGPQMYFLSAVLAFTFLNYFWTRRLSCFLVLSAIYLILEILYVRGLEGRWQIASHRTRHLIHVQLSVFPWLVAISLYGLCCYGGEALWLWWEFRDRYGALWALRVQDQFNRAAVHAGLPVRIDWGCGVVYDPPGSEQTNEAKAAELLKAVLKRFGACPSQDDETKPP
jgi:hypothetical protein